MKSDAVVYASRRQRLSLIREAALTVAIAVTVAIGQTGSATAADTNWIHFTANNGVFRVTPSGAAAIYQEPTWGFYHLAVNNANGDIVGGSDAVITLLNSGGQVQRQFYSEGTISTARQMVPDDCGRDIKGIDWLSTDRIVWSTEYVPQAAKPGWNPSSPDCTNAVEPVSGVVVGHIRNMNPYADSSGAVLVEPPTLGLGGTGYAFELSVSPDGRILDHNKMLTGGDAYNGAAWAYPQAQQADVWGSWDYLDDRVDDVCADAGNTPALLMRTDYVEVKSASNIFLPTKGQTINVGAHANAIACSPDTVDQYALAMEDGRILVGGSGGFQEASKSPNGAATNVDWPTLSNSAPTPSAPKVPRVRVLFPKRNGKYKRKRFKNVRGKVANADSVKQVKVSLKRKRGKRCRWLSHSKMKRRSCRKPVWLKAKGVKNWKARISKRQRRALKSGRYTFTVQLNDANGNQISAEGKASVRFRIRK